MPESLKGSVITSDLGIESWRFRRSPRHGGSSSHGGSESARREDHVPSIPVSVAFGGVEKR
eukprot:6334870-Prymnesium_polylepis.1